MVLVVDDPVLGTIEQVGRPVKFPQVSSSMIAPASEDDDAAELCGGSDSSNLSLSGITTSAATLLDGVKILDLGAFFAGPYSSRLLDDLGADVIKVESVVGDQLRGLERCFIPAQAGKRSVALDLMNPDVRPAVDALIKWADVIHHNMRPGAAERLGVAYEQVARLNPQVVYLHAPGWGTSGANYRRQSFEPLMSGFVGVSYESGGQCNPPTSPMCNGDPGNGLLGAAAILMGLLQQRRTGAGVYIENPQLNGKMAHLAHVVRRADGQVLGAGKLDPVQLGISAVNALYPTSDGWVCLVAEKPKHLVSLGRLIGHDLEADPRFATAVSREEHDSALRDLI